MIDEDVSRSNSEIRRLDKSFQHAYRGLKYSIANERNFQIELVVAVFVLALIAILKVKNWEAIVLIFMIMWVLIMELINTVLERIVDIIKPRIHPYARLVKDVMAAVVLISAIVAIGVGLIIFLPYIKELLKYL
jgi:undecaprenol kinase